MSREDMMSVEIEVTRQTVAYAPGDGSVLWLDDKSEEAAFNDLRPVERAILSARLRAMADLADKAGEFR